MTSSKSLKTEGWNKVFKTFEISSNFSKDTSKNAENKIKLNKRLFLIKYER